MSEEINKSEGSCPRLKLVFGDNDKCDAIGIVSGPVTFDVLKKELIVKAKLTEKGIKFIKSLQKQIS